MTGGERPKPAVSDLHVAALRAHLAGDAVAVARALDRLRGEAGLDGLAALAQAALVLAASRSFAPTWTQAAVIQYVAAIRAIFSEQPDLLNPLAAESELRNALGEGLPAWPDETARAHAQVILLAALARSLELDDTGIDELLNRALEL